MSLLCGRMHLVSTGSIITPFFPGTCSLFLILLVPALKRLASAGDTLAPFTLTNTGLMSSMSCFLGILLLLVLLGISGMSSLLTPSETL